MNFLDSIVNFFTLIWNFISNVVASLLNAVMIMTSAVSETLKIAGFMPTILTTSLLIVVMVAVINYLIGR